MSLETVRRQRYENTTDDLDLGRAPPVRGPTCNHDVWQPARQSCHCCGVQDHMDFHVPDDIWSAVVPAPLDTVAVCLRCFDSLAAERKIPYAHAIEYLDFFGDRASISFSVDSAVDRDEQL